MYIHTYIHIDMGLCRYAQAHVDMSQLQQVMVIGCRSRSWRRQRYHAEEATCTSCLVDMHLHARREERSNKEEG